MSRTPIRGERVSLHPRSLADAPRDYIWRKDAELAELNGQRPLKISFIHFLTQFESSSGSEHPSKDFFSIKTIAEGRYIGNCAIYNIDWEHAEAHVGIVIGDRRYWGKGYGCDAFRSLMDYAFNHLGMHRLNLKTLESNVRARKCFSRCGFQPCGSLLENSDTYILMQLSAEDYAKTRLSPQIAMRTH